MLYKFVKGIVPVIYLRGLRMAYRDTFYPLNITLYWIMVICLVFKHKKSLAFYTRDFSIYACYVTFLSVDRNK